MDWERIKHIDNRKDLARKINEDQLNMSYLMKRFEKRCSSYMEYIDMNKLPNQEWSTSFIDNTLFSIKNLNL